MSVLSETPQETALVPAGPTGRGRILILAVGNSHAGDDGFGPAVHQALKAEAEIPGVELADGAIYGIDLLSELEDFERLILVDAIRPRGGDAPAGVGERGLEEAAGRSDHWGGRPDPVPGEVVVFRLSEVELEDPDPRFSLHDLSFGGCLRLARLLGLRLPEICVVGFVLPPEGISEDVSLSPSAAAAVEAGVKAVRGLLA